MTWLVVIVALGVSCTVSWTPFRFRRSAAGRAKALDRYARRVNLALHPAVNDLVMRRLKVRDRAVLIGGFGGTAAAVVASLTWHTSSMQPPRWLFVMACVTAGVAIAAAVGSLHARFEAVADAPRYARAQVPTASDYLSPIALWLGRIIVATAVTAWLVLDAVPAWMSAPGATADQISPGATVAVIASVFAQVGAEIAFRTVLTVGQHASSPLELAWDDALRAAILRDLLTVPFTVSILALLTTALFGVTGDDTTREAMAAGVFPVTIVLAAVTAGFFSADETRFWTRLWEPGAASAPAVAGSAS